MAYLTIHRGKFELLTGQEEILRTKAGIDTNLAFRGLT